MAFKVKNLMIHILPSIGEKSQLLPGLGLAQGNVCDIFHISIQWCIVISCWPWTPLIPFQPIDILSDPAALAILKGQLQEALAKVQEQERIINEKMGPQTVEEAQALEKELEAALDEVKLQKEQLRNKAAGGQG